MTTQHARLAGSQRPDPHRAIPGRGGKLAAIGRERKAGDRRFVTLKNAGRPVSAGRPDRNAAIFAGARKTAVAQENHRVHGAFVKTQHLLGRVGDQRPANDRGVEAAGRCTFAVGRNRKRAYRPAVTAQLRQRRAGPQCDQQHERHQQLPHVASPLGRMPSASMRARTSAVRSAARNACTAGRSRRLSASRKS